MASLRIVLVRPKEPANIGSVARSMKNFGLTDLVLVSPQRPVSARAYALASHADDVLGQARTVSTVIEAVADCALAFATTALTRATPQPCYTPHEATCQLPPQGAAILFGPEDHGLSNDDLSYCQGLITIPTAEYTSLNLAQAVTIIAYEWFLSRADAPSVTPAAPLAKRQALEGMYEHLRETLYQIGYTDSQREQGAMRFFRRVFDAANLNSAEVQTLRGLWRQVQWASKRHP